MSHVSPLSPSTPESSESPLSESDIEHFLQYGFIRVPGCIDRDFCAQQVRRGWERSGYNPNDRATWVTDRLHLGSKVHWPVSEVSPKALAVIGQLCGGHERITTPQWSDAFIINFKIGIDEPWADPSPNTKGWHKDGDFFRHFLDSPEQGLLTIVIWQDVASRGGATFIAPDSIGPVARYLQARPEGVDPNGFGRIIDDCHHFGEAEGKAGDVYFLHPFMLHASSPNHSGIARFITNPPVHYREPMRFDRPRAEQSPVEQAIMRHLGVERLDYRITGKRELLDPRLVHEQGRKEAEEARRKLLAP